MKTMTALFAVFLAACGSGAATADDAAVRSFLRPYVDGEHREASNRARDRYRHPLDVLTFFGVRPDATVVEIVPGGGWWTEILAPALKERGRYIGVTVGTVVEGAPEYRVRRHQALLAKLAAAPEHYARVEFTELVPGRTAIAAPSSADVVLTFRNVHNWMESGTAEAMFAAFYHVLEPGGVLGVVEHRAAPGTPIQTMIETGYVTEEHVVRLAAKAGFVLDARSEINANPKDTKNYPAGVWMLPPSLRLCAQMPAGAERDACAAQYRAIGESDRMTLRFRKPVA